MCLWHWLYTPLVAGKAIQACNYSRIRFSLFMVRTVFNKDVVIMRGLLKYNQQVSLCEQPIYGTNAAELMWTINR